MTINSSSNYFVPLSNTIHKKWIATLKEGRILYLYSMFGYGKTTQAIYFAKTYFLNWTHFSAEDSDFLEKTEAYISSFQKKAGKTLLILDDIQWITNPEKQQHLFALLLQQKQYGNHLQVMLLSRGGLPEFLVPLRVAQSLSTVDKTDLVLEQSQLLELFSSQKELVHYSAKKMDQLIAHCLQLTDGCALLVQIYLQRICAYPDDPQTAGTLATRDVYYQLESQLFQKWPEEYMNRLYLLGACSSFPTNLAVCLLDCDAQAFLREIMYLDSFLRYEAPDKFHFHYTFAWYFSVRLSKLEEGVRNNVYETAAAYFEEQRNFEEALRCYKLANRLDKIVDVVVYLLENADGCVFAQLSEEYMDLLTPELEEKNPRIIGAKAMFAAYRMDPKTNREYLQKLEKLAKTATDSETQNEHISVYIRTLIASPCVNAGELKENLLLCSQYVQKNGTAIKNIMPTSNSASILNGGADLLFWAPYKSVLFPVMKKATLLTLGVEGVGIPDACLGEFLYEQNKSVQAISSLTQALSDANFKGSIRSQYAITGIMARLLQSEGQAEASHDILTNIYDKAKQLNYAELLPNIEGTLVHCALLTQDVEQYTHWLNTNAPDEYRTFFITSRYVLLAKARVYTALGRELEALHIIHILQEYAVLYERHYMQIELLILEAIILFRRQDNWQEPLTAAVKKAEPYGIMRIFSDQGIALIPLWKQMDWKKEPDISSRYVNEIERDLVTMSAHYPKYLEVPRPFGSLTDRELEVLLLLSKGSSNTQIAEKLDINLGTAKFHVSNIIKKLKAENRTEAARIAQEQNLV